MFISLSDSEFEDKSLGRQVCKEWNDIVCTHCNSEQILDPRVGLECKSKENMPRRKNRM